MFNWVNDIKPQHSGEHPLPPSCLLLHGRLLLLTEAWSLLSVLSAGGQAMRPPTSGNQAA